jgi:hypothetical protein
MRLGCLSTGKPGPVRDAPRTYSHPGDTEMSDEPIDDGMIERAAKAACDYPELWDGAPEDGWKGYWRTKARKILVAALSPETPK